MTSHCSTSARSGFAARRLASIGSVSQLTIRSRTEDDDCGRGVQVRGGVVEPPAPCGCPVGTVMEVRNLFFNTPVRHRFLKTAQTEKGHIVEAFTRLALANPKIHFVLNEQRQTDSTICPRRRVGPIGSKRSLVARSLRR